MRDLKAYPRRIEIAEIRHHIRGGSAFDVERELPNMREGDLLVGAFTNDQVGFNRPFRGAGTYRTHIPGLYLCGSSSHPGGNITGLPGYNAAQVVLGDLGLPARKFPLS